MIGIVSRRGSKATPEAAQRTDYRPYFMSPIQLGPEFFNSRKRYWYSEIGSISILVQLNRGCPSPE